MNAQKLAKQHKGPFTSHDEMAVFLVSVLNHKTRVSSVSG